MGLMRLTRLCMGFTSASEILQRVMSTVLSGLPGVRWVHDDIIVYACDIQQHNIRLASCLQRLREHGLTLNPAKCKIAVPEVDFLAMRLSAKGIQPADSKVTAIKNFKEPGNASEVRSFLGLVTFVSRFIPGLADTAKPLRDLTKKNVTWQWGAEQTQAFRAVQNYITSNSTLVFFDKNRPTELIVDASPTGLGAILCQVQQDGVAKPVAFASRALSAVESRYSQTEREALAIKFGCLKFRHYLSGAANFTIVTDHKPLTFMFKPGSRPPPHIERMALSIQDMQFNVIYRPGPSNPSDILSRQPDPLPTSTNVGEIRDSSYIGSIAQAATPKGLSLQQVREATAQDATLTAALSSLRTGNWDMRDGEIRRLHAVRHELSEMSGVLMRDQRLVIPDAQRSTILQLAHQGHQGETKTILRLNSKVW